MKLNSNQTNILLICIEMRCAIIKREYDDDDDVDDDDDDDDDEVSVLADKLRK